jgi:methyl-accepting chemotaxis protein
MKIKIKLSLMVIAIVAAIVTTVAVLLIQRASAISQELSQKSLMNMAVARANFW